MDLDNVRRCVFLEYLEVVSWKDGGFGACVESLY